MRGRAPGHTSCTDPQQAARPLLTYEVVSAQRCPGVGFGLRTSRKSNAWVLRARPVDDHPLPAQTRAFFHFRALRGAPRAARSASERLEAGELARAARAPRCAERGPCMYRCRRHPRGRSSPSPGHATAHFSPTSAALTRAAATIRPHSAGRPRRDARGIDQHVLSLFHAIASRHAPARLVDRPASLLQRAVSAAPSADRLWRGVGRACGRAPCTVRSCSVLGSRAGRAASGWATDVRQ